jgi:hypothetical protein
MNDPRPDELLEECGKIAHRLGLALAWTDSLTGAGAKACSRSGSAAWKNARQLAGTEDEAAAFFVTRARRRNPAVVLGASGLVGVECDDVDELPVALPETVTIRSRRGLHRYYRPPAGRKPMKVQIDRSGVVVSDDGYLIGAGALHESGHVYAYEGAAAIAELSAKTCDALAGLAGEARVETRRRFNAGEPIPEGQRDVGIFWLAVDLLRNGHCVAEALERVLEAARTQCMPPLDERLARKQFNGAAKWVAEHPTEAERANAKARRRLEERRDGAPVEPASPPKARKRPLERRQLRGVAAEPVDWLIDKVVPLGTLSLVAGTGGLGKSALLLVWAREVTLVGGNVLLISYEDAAAQVIRPRFEALGGDLDRLYELSVDALAGEISFPTDLPELDRHVRETEARLLLIDPVSAAIDLRLDAHKDQDVRVVLGQLARLAERERVAIVQNAHLNKAPGSDPYLRINGSTAFYNASRSVLTVTRDPLEPDWSRLIAHHKSNYGALADVERWRIVPVTVPSARGPIDVMTLEFVEVAEGVSRDDVLAPRSIGQDKLEKAMDFLEQALSDGEWHDSAGLKALAGVAERTLKRAAQELDVEHERRGFPSTTWWRLAQSGQPISPDLGPTGAPRMNSGEATAQESSWANGSGDRRDCTHTRHWLAHDGTWRCRECEPPAFPGEVVGETG